MSTNTASIRRRPKWHHPHPPPPPTPKILHFPRHPRRRSSSALKVPSSSTTLPTLETLFHREERACACPRRRRRDRVLGRRTETSTSVALVEDKEEDQDEEEEDNNDNNKWMFEAEMLRAECNLLRMQKDIALKKLHRTRSHLDTTLTSALHSLLSGRMKISEGGNTDIEMVLDEEIRHLIEKLQRLHKRSGRVLLKDSSQGTCRSNTNNFDKRVSVLQTRLDKIGGGSSVDEIYLREFQEMENVSLSIKKTSGRIDDDSLLARGKLNVEILRRKMEGLSKGILLQRMEEEYNSLLSTATTSLASSASTSKRIEFQDSSSSSTREKVCGEGNLCSGHCKSIVRRIVEQVRAETEQWSQMQEMLAQVREEMEQLQASRQFWEDRAHHSHFQIHSLHNSVQEWRERALSSESKTKELEAKISVLSGDLERLRKEKNNSVNASKCSQVQLETQNELEKRVVVCCSKENTPVMENSTHIIENSSKLNKEVVLGGGNGERRAAQATIGGVLATKRLPFRDIGNSTMKTMLHLRQNGKAVFPLQSHLSSNADKKIMY